MRPPFRRRLPLEDVFLRLLPPPLRPLALGAAGAGARAGAWARATEVEVTEVEVAEVEVVIEGDSPEMDSPGIDSPGGDSLGADSLGGAASTKERRLTSLVSSAGLAAAAWLGVGLER